MSGCHRGAFCPGCPSNGVLSVELHAHSSLSYDGRDPVDRLLEQAAAVGLDGLVITDHDEIAASLDAAGAAPGYGLVGIPGTEVTSAAGHVLALGVEELVPAGLSFQETVDAIHSLGGIAVVPHPFQKSRSGVLAKISEEELTAADAIEVFNSRLLTGRANRRAERFALQHNVPVTAGSDAHICEMIGRGITHVDTDERTADAVLAAIREGHTSVEGRRTPWHISFRQAAGGVKRRVTTRVQRMLGRGANRQ